jgi:ABC-type lipoprotein release transport system permease subunit
MAQKDKSLEVGFFLAVSDIKRSNPWTTGLIIFVMMLTFFNMILLNGILIGLAQGMTGTFKLYYSSDILITPSTNKDVIEQSDTIMAVTKSLPLFKNQTVRYTGPATLEYGYQTKLKLSDSSESVTSQLVGINPVLEDKVTHLSKMIVAGNYLDPTDMDEVLLGSDLIKKYTSAKAGSAGTKILKTADIGSKLRLSVNGIQKEVRVKGVISTNNSTVDGRIYITDTAARQLLGRTDLNVNEIAISLTDGSLGNAAKEYIQENLRHADDVLIQTSKEAIPSGLSQMIKTFNLLGMMVAGIALFVGAITIFIVIYVNAITRRKFIGILKGIGITSRTIEISYIFQALFYALSGIIIASILLLGFLTPYFILHPIRYPVGTGSLAITTNDIVTRAIVLSITAFISGFVPAWLVTKQNTLDAILGR